MPEKILPKPQTDLPLPEKELSATVKSGSASQGLPLQSYKGKSVFKSKFFLGFMGLSFLIAFLIGGLVLGNQ